MLTRGATLEALRSGGLRVSRAGNTRHCRPRAGTALELGVHDFVFLTVKAQILPQLAPTLVPLLGPATVVVSGTNGIPWWFFQDFGGAAATTYVSSRSTPAVFKSERFRGRARWDRWYMPRHACWPPHRWKLSPSIGCCSASRAGKSRRGLNPWWAHFATAASTHRRQAEFAKMCGASFGVI